MNARCRTCDVRCDSPAFADCAHPHCPFDHSVILTAEAAINDEQVERMERALFPLATVHT